MLVQGEEPSGRTVVPEVCQLQRPQDRLCSGDLLPAIFTNEINLFGDEFLISVVTKKFNSNFILFFTRVTTIEIYVQLLLLNLFAMSLFLPNLFLFNLSC